VSSGPSRGADEIAAHLAQIERARAEKDVHERGPAFDRHVDIGNRESLAFHHDRGKDSMSVNRYAKFNGDRGAFLFIGIGLQATRSSIGESYAKWIEETCLDIHTGP
jgi:hypothetical protein